MPHHKKVNRAKRLPGLKAAQTTIKVHRKKKLPRKPVNPIVDDGTFDFSTPPDSLNVDGVELWRSIVSVLTKVGELHSTDRYGLEAMCARWQKMRKKMRAGMDIPVHEEKLFERMLIEYGMTPAARVAIDRQGKMRANGPPAKGFEPRGKNKQKIFEEQHIRQEAPDESPELDDIEKEPPPMLRSVA